MRKTDRVGARWSEDVKGIISLQLYSRRSCLSMMTYAAGADWWGAANVGVEQADGSFGSISEPEYRSASSLAPEHYSRLKREFDVKMQRIIKPLVNRIWRTDLRRHASTHIVRYVAGDFYLAHTDNMLESDHYRYFTVLCYLNDDFEGGNTSFPTLDYSIRPRAGKTIVFPSSYLHCADPIIKGEKYVLVSWLTGPPPIKWI